MLLPCPRTGISVVVWLHMCRGCEPAAAVLALGLLWMSRCDVRLCACQPDCNSTVSHVE